MTYKARNSKNQQESKASKGIIVKGNKKENDHTNGLIEDCEQTRIHLSEKNLGTVRNISEKLSVNNDKLTNMENAMTDQEKLVESVEKNDKLENQNISNMHEILLKNDNSKSKCITDASIGGGAITMACGTFAALAFNPTFGILGIFGGVAFLYGLARKVSSCHGHLYKKPNSAVKSIDIERGMHKNCKELFTSIT